LCKLLRWSVYWLLMTGEDWWKLSCHLNIHG
jgi:predicted RNA-binding protein